MPKASARATWSPATVVPKRAESGARSPPLSSGGSREASTSRTDASSELPPLGRAHEELTEHREVHVVAAELGDGREDVLVAALGQHPRDLHIGVRAGLHLAEHLEDRALVEHHRAVGVLQHDGAAHLHLDVGRDQVEHLDREVGIDEGVVEHGLAPLAVGHHRQQLTVLAVEELGPRVRGRPPMNSW